MPTIKLKKATADYIAEKEKEKIKDKEKNGTPIKKEKTHKKPEKKMMIGLVGEVLQEKRKRTVPPSDQFVIDWIDEHLESRPGVCIQLVRLYECYADACQSTTTPSLVVDKPDFQKLLLGRVGKEFAFKPSSPLKHVITEKNVKEKRKNVNQKKYNASATLKEVLKELGNSRRGLMFRSIMKNMCARNPNIKRGHIRSGLEAAMYRGEVSRVRGVGYAGSYRLIGEPSESETEEQEKAEKIKAESNGNTDVDSKLKRKKKKSETTGSEEGDQKSEVKMEERETNKKTKKKSKKKTTKKKVFYRPVTIDSINHSEPKRLEDVFPLAITFGCEPKETSINKIKNYIVKYYPTIDVNKSLQKALDTGVEEGVFEKISNLTYRLQVDEFDPYKEESLQECITSAIIASNEPKVSSIKSIKKYIQDYHQEFNLDDKPTSLSNALERASSKRILKQISGIGATGSVKLLLPFIPSPGILSGNECTVSKEYTAKPSKSRSTPMNKVEELHIVRYPPRNRSKVVKSKNSPDNDKKKAINGGVVQKKTTAKKGKTKTAAAKKNVPKDSKKGDLEEEGAAKKKQIKTEGNVQHSKTSRRKIGYVSESDEEKIPPPRRIKRTRAKPKIKQTIMRQRRLRDQSNVSYTEEESEVDESSSDEEEPTAKKSRGKK